MLRANSSDHLVRFVIVDERFKLLVGHAGELANDVGFHLLNLEPAQFAPLHFGLSCSADLTVGLGHLTKDPQFLHMFFKG